MYRNGSVDAQKDNFSTYLGLNMKCFQETYLDTNMLSSPSVSPTSSSAPLSPLSPVMAPLSPPPFQQQQQQQQQMNLSSIALTSGVGGNQNHNNNMIMMNCLNQQFAMAQQQLALAANAAAAAAACGGTGGGATTQQQSHDEISKSLKMFAMLTAKSSVNGKELTTQPSQVDAVMQDFACNGYVSEDANRYQQFQSTSHLLSTSDTSQAINTNAFTMQQLQQWQQSQLQQLQQPHFNDGRGNVWTLLSNRMPQQQQQQQQTQLRIHQKIIQQTTASPFDYNAAKKTTKRYNTKNEKYTSAKHCVFCENNNEAEAVVKSHAVRDSLGRVLCPKLRTYICPICKASGDQAHTVKYCPQKPIITMEDAIKAEAFRLSKGGTFYKQQMKV